MIGHMRSGRITRLLGSLHAFTVTLVTCILPMRTSPPVKDTLLRLGLPALVEFPSSTVATIRVGSDQARHEYGPHRGSTAGPAALVRKRTVWAVGVASSLRRRGTVSPLEEIVVESYGH